MNNNPAVSVIIPHFNGIEILRACLTSLLANSFESYEILLVDNGSTDGSQEMVKSEFPQVTLIQNTENLGYAGGCNTGMRIAKGEWFLLLNNDTEVQPNFLSELYNAACKDETAGILQPKILSIQDKELFDYSGGAGGEIDIFGYPFVRGRLFEFIEKDEGQYDRINPEIFWASGTACLLRKSMIEKIGMLDEDFFAHMEEIDLNWRSHLAGYRSLVVTGTFLYHYSGYTLGAGNKRKMYLNHRNNLVMLIKNYSLKNLLWILPVRILMEIATLFLALLKTRFKWAAAILQSLGYVLFNFLSIWKKRERQRDLRVVSDREIMGKMFKGSIAWQYFALGRKSRDLIKKM